MTRRNPRSDSCVYASCIKSVRAFAESAVRCGLHSLVFCLSDSVPKAEFEKIQAEYASKLLLIRACEGELPKSELFSDVGCDVLIGFPQTLELGGVTIPFPMTGKEAREALRYTEGSALALMRAAYRALTALPSKTQCDAVRLFDPIGLWNADGKLFDPSDKMFELVEWRAIEDLLRQDVVIELCVEPPVQGALPIRYPNFRLLRLIGEACGRVTLSSRATDPQQLCQGFRTAFSQLRACGIGSVYIRQKEEWKALSL